MKQYIITIIGSAVLCTAAHILTPAAWQKYVKIITGLVILSVIAAPIANFTDFDIFSSFSIEESEIDENLQTDIVAKELKKRVEADIAGRIKAEFSAEAEATVDIGVAQSGEITGVSHIKIKLKAGAQKEQIITRMCEVYGTKKDEVEIYGP